MLISDDENNEATPCVRASRCLNSGRKRDEHDGIGVIIIIKGPHEYHDRGARRDTKLRASCFKFPIQPFDFTSNSVPEVSAQRRLVRVVGDDRASQG